MVCSKVRKPDPASTLNLNNALVLLAQYGQAVINRVDFIRARVRPSLAVGRRREQT